MNYSRLAMTTRIILVGASMIVTAIAPCMAQNSTATTEEDVRRIVERAMASVALAEAQATRSVAEMQIRLIQKDSELERLKTDLVSREAKMRSGHTAEIERMRTEHQKAADAIRRDAEEALAEKRTLLAWVENREAEAESSVRRTKEMTERVAELEIELVRATRLLAESRDALDRYQALHTLWADSISRLSAMLNQARAEKEDLRGRMESFQSRASMAEEAMDASNMGATQDLARIERSWRETVAASNAGATRELTRIEGAWRETVAASTASAARELARIGSMWRETVVASTASATRELTRIGSLWSETVAASQARIAELQNMVAAESVKTASVMALIQARDKMIAESSVMSNEQVEGLRTENARLADKLVAQQNRSRVLDDAMRVEREKMISAEAELRVREQIIKESASIIAVESARIQSDLTRLQDRDVALQTRAKVLEDAMRSESMRAAALDSELSALRLRGTSEQSGAESRVRSMQSIVDALSMERQTLATTADSLKAEAARSAEEFRVLKQERNALAAYVDEARMERDSAIDELAANRIEMAESMRAMEVSASAIISLRAERDAALALSAQPRSDTRLEIALLRIDGYERELSALRIVLLQGMSGIGTVSSGNDGASPASAERSPGMRGRTEPVTVSPIPKDSAAQGIISSGTETLTGSDHADRSSTGRHVAGHGLPRAIPLAQMLNTLAFEELSAIPAIGPTRAGAIIWYRDNIAPLSSEDDLKSVPGFNDERIRTLRIWRGSQEESTK